jgi:serine/threonine protein kinase
MRGFLGALPPTGTALAFPRWASGKDDINSQYLLLWDERLCFGGLNSLNRAAAGLQDVAPGCSCMIKAKTRNAKGARTVKVIPKGHILYPKLFQSQLSAHWDIRHPGICKLIDVFEDSTYVYLVMEHLAGPSLLEKVVSDPHFNERDVSLTIKALLSAVAYLHQHKLLHQNLHPENLRFVTNFRTGPGSSDYEKGLKLMDFGLCLQAKQLTSVLNATGMDDTKPPPPMQVVGSRSSAGSRCIPPELRAHQEATSHADMCKLAAGLSRETREYRLPYKTSEEKSVHHLLEKSDMWSVGCIMHLLLTGTLPPESSTSSSGPPIQLPAGIHVSGHALCSALLDPNPRNRPSAAQALRSEWFSHCDLVKNNTRGLRKLQESAAGTSAGPSSPLPLEVKMLLGRHHAQCQLRKLLLAASAVSSLPCISLDAWPSGPVGMIPEDHRSLASCVLPVPPHSPDSVITAAMKVIYAMCQTTFRSLLSNVPAQGAAAEHVDQAALMEMLSKAGDLLSKADLRAMFPSSRGQGVSVFEFSDVIFQCICA